MAIVSGSGFLPMISIRRLRKVFQVKEEAVAALPNLDLEVEREEFFVLLGPSGSGKSTLLRRIAGIEIPEDGEISIDGRPIYSASDGLFVRPEHRGLGMVFQSYERPFGQCPAGGRRDPGTRASRDDSELDVVAHTR